MALILSPTSILKDLRCNLDFSNPRSYKFGNTLFDITSNGNNGVLRNIEYSPIFGGTGFFSISSSLAINDSATLNATPLISRTTSFWYYLSGESSNTTVLYKEGDQEEGIIVYVQNNYLNCELYTNKGIYYSIIKQAFTTVNEWHNLVLNYFDAPPYFVIYHDLGRDDYDIVSEPISTFLYYNGELLLYNGEELQASIFSFSPNSIILGSLSGSSYINQQLVTGNGINDYNLRGSINNFFTASNNVLTEEEIKRNYSQFKGKYGITGSSEIPREGLICHLEPSNKNSYTEGNKVWNDISYNDNDAILFNGSSSAQEGNAINFDGVDEYASIETNPFTSRREPFTRVIWFKYNNINSTGSSSVNIMGDDTYNSGSRLTVNTDTQILTSINSLSAIQGSELLLQELNLINNNLPENIETFNKITPTLYDDLFLGYTSILLQKDNRLYAYGEDNGQFGNNVLSADNKLASPYFSGRFLTEFFELKTPYGFAKIVSYGLYHIILSAYNDLYYSFGDQTINVFNTPPFTFNQSDFKFDNVKGDFTSSAFLGLSGGKLWAGGYSTALDGVGNNLGKGYNGLWATEPLTLISSISSFTDIFPGTSSSFVLSGNRLFSTGWSATNGHNVGLTRFTLLPGEWKKVVCSLNVTFALSADNKTWFSVGNLNDSGVLGVGDYLDRQFFTKIDGEIEDIVYLDFESSYAIGISGTSLFYTGTLPNMTRTNKFTYLGDYNLKTCGPLIYADSLPNFIEKSQRKSTPTNNFSLVGITKNLNKDYSIKKTETYIKNLSGWNMIVQSYDSNSANKLYIIGKEKTQIVDYPVSELIFDRSINSIKVGEMGLGCDIGTVLIYNRELKYSEIIKVFNATKKRFGY